MKIKQKHCTYKEALDKRGSINKKPIKPNRFFRTLMRLVSEPELKEVGFHYKSINMERLAKNEPCLILMNHSSLIDLKIAVHIFSDRPFNIVCTSDGFVGKDWMMRHIGCIPAKKFVNDPVLVKNMNYVLKKLKSSILMYPEASYSFDGTATPLPESLGKCLKLLGVPVVMIRTFGAFARDPLYNGLQKRKTAVSAEVEYLLSPDDIASMCVRDLNERLKRTFSFDYFRWQQDNKVLIKEKFRADKLHRVLYRCPSCHHEGKMLGKGEFISCQNCGKKYHLTEDGFLKAEEGETEFDHIPDWYLWERKCVQKEIQSGIYNLDLPVKIAVMVNTRCIYHVGEGVLTHDMQGFRLHSSDGELLYEQSVSAGSYSLYADYFWYEIGDVICIGNTDILYYCFPKDSCFPVAKARLATETLYQMH